MKCFIVLVSLVCAVYATRENFHDPRNPIQYVDYGHGQGNWKRVTELYAVIRTNHVNNNGRINFPHSGELEKQFKATSAPKDERGHLVASQFSGPATWYNLSPQNARVNRNKDFQALTTGWYETECEVRKFLDKGGNREVHWKVDMTYVRDSNRPDEYRLQVQFYENGRRDGNGVDTRIRNPFEKEDSTFWICRSCRSNTHDPSHDCQRAK